MFPHGQWIPAEIQIRESLPACFRHKWGDANVKSGKIVAIDHNAKASIFHHADFGIMGEYGDIVPELIERVKNGFTFGLEPVKKQ